MCAQLLVVTGYNCYGPYSCTKQVGKWPQMMHLSTTFQQEAGAIFACLFPLLGTRKRKKRECEHSNSACTLVMGVLHIDKSAITPFSILLKCIKSAKCCNLHKLCKLGQFAHLILGLGLSFCIILFGFTGHGEGLGTLQTNEEPTLITIHLKPTTPSSFLTLASAPWRKGPLLKGDTAPASCPLGQMESPEPIPSFAHIMRSRSTAVETMAVVQHQQYASHFSNYFSVYLSLRSPLMLG